MTKQNSRVYGHGEHSKNPKSIGIMKKNQSRLGGGGGLSLAAFANAKSTNANYNPAIIKRQREFYKNAKCVNKYKKSLKQQNEPQTLLDQISEGNDNTASSSKDMGKKNNKNRKPSMEQIYKMKKKEEEQARLEKEALFQAKKEARERSEAQRKAAREKMYKKTKSGQPVMKYRIEHLLQSIQASTS
ncbi:hypothetical protein ACHQM5_014904 [Ranunculus cassubicifolius]